MRTVSNAAWRRVQRASLKRSKAPSHATSTASPFARRRSPSTGRTHPRHETEAMDNKMTAVLDAYHERMRQEEEMRRDGPPASGIDGWLDRMLLAVGPDTGHLINILARSLKTPNILELGTSYGY